MNKLTGFLALLFFILTACSSIDQRLATPTPFPSPTAIPTLIVPTPSSPGNSVTWSTLQVDMDQPEFTDLYETDYGSTRYPPDGGKFLWVHIELQNNGQVEIAIPSEENFSILYASTESKPTYGHRDGYKDYTTLTPAIFPGQRLDGWLRFDVPATAEFGDMLFVYLPESTQVGASYSSPNYPYADDKPTFVWTLDR